MLNESHLKSLLDRYFDQTLTAPELEQLEARLESSARARSLFWEHARLNGQLRELALQRAGRKLMIVSLAGDPAAAAAGFSDDETGPQDEVRHPEFRRPGASLRWGLGLAAGLALLFSVGSLVWHFSKPDGVSRPGPDPSTAQGPKRPVEAVSSAVAVVTGAANVEWAGPGPRCAVGAALDPGVLRLKRGVLQLGFYSGARVSLEGPAEFELVSARAAICRSGKLSAEVPPQAQGFRITTPKMEVVDLGTSFGLDVNDRETEVHVFDGKVEVYNQPGGLRGLVKGNAEAVNQSGDSRNFPAEPDKFLLPTKFWQQLAASSRERHREWLESGARLNQDPTLLIRFSFEDRDEQGARLHNEAANPLAAGYGAVVGGRWKEGRWPGKTSLDFATVSDRVRLSVPGEQAAVTLAAWVRVGNTDRLYNSLFMSDDFYPGALHWQIYEDGRVFLGICPPDGSHANFVTPELFRGDLLNRWVHLAVAYDTTAREVRHYLNGKLVSRDIVPFSQPVRLGTAELGNWNPGTRHLRYPFADEPRPIRHLDGSMDEFELFARALNDREIGELFDEGAPR